MFTYLFFSLFTYLQEENVFLKPTYSTFLALLDNYTPSTSVTESQDAAEWIEIDAFLDAILATDVMNHLYNFLVEHGDYYIYTFRHLSPRAGKSYLSIV